MNSHLLAILALLAALFTAVYFLDPAIGCEGRSQSDATSDVGNSSQSSTSGEDTQRGVAQMDNRDHEGNGGESWLLIDFDSVCDNPYW